MKLILGLLIISVVWAGIGMITARVMDDQVINNQLHVERMLRVLGE